MSTNENDDLKEAYITAIKEADEGDTIVMDEVNDTVENISK